MKRIAVCCLWAIVIAASSSTVTANVPPEVAQYANLRAAGDEEAAAALVAEIRSEGPARLEALLAARDALVDPIFLVEIPDVIELPQELHDLHALIDAVGGQRYCTHSRLFWHTDLTSAQRAATESGKPILSLRMLGKLTDELSCANSRFFRTTLYANREISDLLRERFVLHWETVRPVPVMTVDFGDGRRIVRTITGNSAHYVLDEQARPIDVLPGLHSPKAFQDWLIATDELAGQLAECCSRSRGDVLAAYHRSRLDAITTGWRTDLESLGLVTPRPTEDDPDPAAIERVALSELMTDEIWAACGALHRDDVALDESTRSLIRREQPALPATRIAMTKARIEMPMLGALFEQLENSVAVDTIRNEYELHSQIHEWYLTGGVDDSVAVLNERVYAELFLMPADDEWLGLVDPDVYTGVTNAGIVYDAP